MFWDKISSLYDVFENVYNYRVYSSTGEKVAEFIDDDDTVLECACGTGSITKAIAKNASKVVATDFSEGMLSQASKKCSKWDNITFLKADITNLEFENESFDKVVAGNVIHLLPEPKKALDELSRVVRPGGKIIIPTYINKSSAAASFGVKFVSLLGAEFKQQFDIDSYKDFFIKNGYENVQYYVVEGRMPCAIAVIDQ